MTPADIALAMLRDPEFMTHDHGATIRQLAVVAGVRVRVVSVDLTTLTQKIWETGPEGQEKNDETI